MTLSWEGFLNKDQKAQTLKENIHLLYNLKATSMPKITVSEVKGQVRA